MVKRGYPLGEYIILNLFDPKLISGNPPSSAKAAMDSGVAKMPMKDLG